MLMYEDEQSPTQNLPNKSPVAGQDRGYGSGFGSYGNMGGQSQGFRPPRQPQGMREFLQQPMSPRGRRGPGFAMDYGGGNYGGRQEMFRPSTPPPPPMAAGGFGGGAPPIPDWMRQQNEMMRQQAETAVQQQQASRRTQAIPGLDEPPDVGFPIQQGGRETASLGFNTGSQIPMGMGATPGVRMAGPGAILTREEEGATAPMRFNTGSPIPMGAGMPPGASTMGAPPRQAPPPPPPRQVPGLLTARPQQPTSFGGGGMQYNLSPRFQPTPSFQPSFQPAFQPSFGGFGGMTQPSFGGMGGGGIPSLYGGNYGGGFPMSFAPPPQPSLFGGGFGGGMGGGFGMPSSNTGLFGTNNTALLQALMNIFGRR